MIKKLSQLLQSVMVENIVGNDDVEILSVTADSRKVSPGSLFVAVRGTQVDGHDFIGKAVEMGASLWCVRVCRRLRKLLLSMSE